MIALSDLKFFTNIFDDNVRDFSDTLNSIITTGIIFVLFTVVSFKSYIVSPISCFSPNSPNVPNFDDYIKSYCWIHGTVVLEDDDNTPYNEVDWTNPSVQKIGYYQWIPFILLIQCGCFYFPNLFWNIICHHNNGADLNNILTKTKELASDITNSKMSDQIVGSLEDILFVHRDYRHDPVSELRRKINKKCKFLIASKRLATKLSMYYIFVKFMYIANGIGQIFLLKKFLNMGSWASETYLKIFKLMQSGEDWKQSKYFPLVSFCRVKGIRSVGVSGNTYVSQCVLSLNMLNEKIFIFLFLWFSFVILITFLSLIVWIYQLAKKSSQINRVKKYLKMRKNYKKMDKLIIEKFVVQFLRMDGIFLLHIIRQNAGDVVTSTITNGLFKTYSHKYRRQNFNNDRTSEEIESLSLKLEPGGKGSVKMNFSKPNAPEKDYML